MVAMESEKTQLREEFVKKQMERDASCQDEKSKIEEFKNKELDEISERLDQSEKTVTYLGEVMLHSNQVVEEQENLLKVQADTIHEFNEEVNMGRNCSTLLGAAADRMTLQEEAINLLKSSLVTSRNISELSTSGMDQLDVAPFMLEMLESYNQLAEMIENMKTALEKEGQVESQTPELLIHLADLRSALESASISIDTLEQQAKMIEMQGRSSPSPTECIATSGPEAGSPCVFPFTFLGVSHSSCTTIDGDSVPWCHTKTSWGYCGATCPVEESSIHSSHLLFEGSTSPRH